MPPGSWKSLGAFWCLVQKVFSALQSFRVFLLASLTDLSEAGLQASRSRFKWSTPPAELSCFPYGFLFRIVQSWPGAVQAQILWIDTPYRTSVFFFKWFPWQRCLKLACRPPGPDFTNIHPLQNSCVFLMASFTELFKVACNPQAQTPLIHTPHYIHT